MARAGPAVFFGDIEFYAGDWDARERVGRIDTNRCRLSMLTGEYDYSCTVEHPPPPRRRFPACGSRRCRGSAISRSPRTRRCSPDYLLPILRDIGD